jgi:hypothetical protein
MSDRDQFVEMMEQMWGSTPPPAVEPDPEPEPVRFVGYIAKGQSLAPRSQLLDPCIGAGWWLAGCPEMAPVSQTDGSFDQDPAAA